MASETQYTALITSEHADKPKFSAMVGMVANCFAGVTNTYADIESGFDLDGAIGAQLDSIGLWVGLSRRVNVPITGVYFAFDTENVGFDQGVWKDPYDPEEGITVLDDGTFRQMLRVKIGANSWDGTLPSYVAIMNRALQGTGCYLFAVDNQDMSMSFYIVGSGVSALVRELLVNGYLNFKPEGVRLTEWVASLYFGFDLETTEVNGFDIGAWAEIL